MLNLPRRLLLTAASFAAARISGPAMAAAGQSAWNFGFAALDGGELPFAQFKGRVLLVTNTASFCGYTYQYEGLEKLHATRNAAGLTVIGVPSTDFYQESSDNEKVKQFCDKTFGVKFPMAVISHVRDSKAAPFYVWVRAERDWQPTWNFNKVLVGRDGAIKGTYRATTEPNDPALLSAIDAELARPAPAV